MQQPLNIKHTGDTTSQTAAAGRNVEKPGDNEGNYQMIAAALIPANVPGSHVYQTGIY